MKLHTILRLVLVAALPLVLVYCAKAPYTNRSQIMLIDQAQEMQLGLQASRDILKKEKLERDPKINAMVDRIGGRIAVAAQQPNFEWEFHVIDNDETANAFCLPGGKVFVYTGILRYARDEAQLATVMGHEIAHALARHGGERMSQSLAVQAGGALASAALDIQNPATAQVFQMAYGLGTQVGVLLPFNRSQEAEADQIGLALMAKAGYNPEAAVSFWENMAKGHADKARPPAFLSTHPPEAERIAHIRQLLPWAMQYYRPR